MPHRTITEPGRRDLLKAGLGLTAAAAIAPWDLAHAQAAGPARNKTLILTWSGSREGR